MKISIKDVEHVAKLARLSLTDEEKKIFTEQLSKIIEYAEIINKLKTEDTPPTSHAIPMKNIFRDDKVVPFLHQDIILKNSPDREENMFKVPKILE